MNLRDSPLNIEFVPQLEERLKRNVTESDSLLRKQVVVDPNFLYLDIDRIFFPSRKKDDLLALSLVSWWLPEEFRFYVQLELHRIKCYFTLEDQMLFELLLSTKAEAIIFLMETSLWHTRDFFGNFLPKGEKMANTIKFFKKNKNIVKRPKRKRGYDDHGSRRPDHKWLESHDITFTEEQNSIEQKRDAIKSTSHLLRGGFL